MLACAAMATWQLIESTGATLVRLLQAHVDATLPLTSVKVQLATTTLFKKLPDAGDARITLLLYRVVENPELRNLPRRNFPDGTSRRSPLPLELCYMVTPWGVRSADSPEADADAAAEEHRLLGIAMQAFYDNAEVPRAALFESPTKPVWEPTDNLQVVLESLPVEDHYRIWDSSELPYRVSVTYRVRVLGLDASTAEAYGRVVDASLVAGRLQG